MLLLIIFIPGAGTTSGFTGFLKGIIVGMATDVTGGTTLDIKVVSRVETVGGGSTETEIDYQEGFSVHHSELNCTELC